MRQEFATATDNLAAALRRPKAKGGFGIGQGDRVLLVYPPSLDFLVAFIACLKACIIAVPVFPPGELVPAIQGLKKFQQILVDCYSAFVFYDTSLLRC